MWKAWNARIMVLLNKLLISYILLIIIIIFLSAGILYQTILSAATTLIEHKLHENIRIIVE